MRTRAILNRKHLGWQALKSTARLAAGHLLRGQTNFVKMIWKFNSVYDPRLQLADHERPVRYQMRLPPPHAEHVDRAQLYVHAGRGRQGRATDEATERFVEESRMGTGG